MAYSKEIVFRAFKREETEYVSVGAFLGGSWPVINSGLTLEGLIGDIQRTAGAFYEVNERINADILMVGVGSTALLVPIAGSVYSNAAAPAPFPSFIFIFLGWLLAGGVWFFIRKAQTPDVAANISGHVEDAHRHFREIRANGDA